MCLVRRSRRCAALVLLLLGEAALAQEHSDLRWNRYEYSEMTLEELLSTPLTSAGFFAVDASKSTQSAKLFSHEMMENHGVQSLADLLQAHVPGVNLGSHPSFGDLIGTRGIQVDNNAKTVLLEDNVNVNYRTHWGPLGATLRDPFIGSMENVEVILGPGAITHGSGAINGFINVRTPTGTSRPGLWSKLSVGTGEFGLGELSYGHRFKTSFLSDLFLYAGYASASGFGAVTPPAPAGSAYDDVIRVNATGTPNFKLLGKYRLSTPGERVNLDFKIKLSRLAAGSNSYPSGKYSISDFQPFNYGDLGQGYLESKTLLLVPQVTVHLAPKHTVEITPSAHLLQAQIQNMPWFDAAFEEYRAAQQALGLNPARIAPSGTAEEQYGLRAVYLTEAIPSHKLAAGFTVGRKHFSSVRSRLGAGNWAYSLEGPADFSWNEVGFFAEDVWTPGKFSASLGLRYDLAHFSAYDTGVRGGGSVDGFADASNFSARAAAAYTLSSNSTARASFQQGYRFPDAANYLDVITLNRAYEGIVRRIPDLKPEASDLFEIGYRHLLLDKTLELTASVYYGRYRSTIGWVDWASRYPEDVPALLGSPAYVGYWQSFGNSETVIQSLGGELGVTYRPDQNLDVTASYSYSRPLGRADPNLPLASWDNSNWFQFPTHLVKGSGSYALGDFRVTLTAYFRTGPDSRGTAANPIYDPSELPVNERERARPSFTLDAMVAYSPTKNVTLSLVVKNVTYNRVQPISFTNTLYHGNAVAGVPALRFNTVVSF